MFLKHFSNNHKIQFRQWKMSQLIEELINEYPEDNEVIEVPFGTTTDLDEAVFGFNLLKDLIISIQTFDNLSSHTLPTLESLNNHKEDIKDLLRQFQLIKKNRVFDWLYPKNEYIAIIQRYQITKTNPSGYYKNRPITLSSKEFIELCRDNRLQILKWFHKINPNVEYQTAFVVACANGHLDIAKWLFSVYPICFGNEAGNIRRIHSPHSNIIEWLETMNKDYVALQTNKKIAPMSKEEIQTQIKEYQDTVFEFPPFYLS